MTAKTLDEIREQYVTLCRQAGVQSRFNTSPQNDGSAHVELLSGTYLYVITERGSELERRSTQNPDELLYWLVSYSVFAEAADYELRNRVRGRSFRRMLFEREVELFGRISQDWARRKRNQIEDILAKSPFDDQREG